MSCFLYETFPHIRFFTWHDFSVNKRPSMITHRDLTSDHTWSKTRCFDLATVGIPLNFSPGPQPLTLPDHNGLIYLTSKIFSLASMQSDLNLPSTGSNLAYTWRKPYYLQNVDLIPSGIVWYPTWLPNVSPSGSSSWPLTWPYRI